MTAGPPTRNVPEPVPITGVTGGVAGLAAAYSRVRALAAAYDAAGNRMRGQAGLGGRTLVNGDLLESGLLSPRTFADAEGAVLAATTGPDGILVESVAWEADARLIDATVHAFEGTDDLVRAAFEAIDYAVMRAAGHALVFGMVAFGPAGLVAMAVVGSQVPVDDLVAERPGLVQHVFNGAGGLLDGLVGGFTPPPLPWVLPRHPTTEDAAGLLAGSYGPEGGHMVQRTGEPVVTAPPDSLAGLIQQLERTTALPEGTIEIQTIVDDDGRRRHIVYLPGSDDMVTLPWTRDDTVRDLPANLLLMSGQDTAYSRGVLDALEQAGVEPDEKVALVGYSQGGMTALHLSASQSDHHITQVVTAGAPSAQVLGHPDGVSVMAFENKGDVVPLTDGEDTTDSEQQVTIAFDAQGTDVADSHGLGKYAQGAAAADASDHPSITHQVETMQQDGFLPGAVETQQATSQTWQIIRDPDAGRGRE